jgi:ketosteroid isomerase-like protein
MKKTLYVMLVAVMIITSCQSKTKTASNDAVAIRNIEDQWVAAIKAKDIDKIVSFCSPDIVIMDANVPISVGHQAVRKSYSSPADATTSISHSETVDALEVSASGDLAYTRGTAQQSRNTPNGIINESIKWVSIYKKINGEWKVIVNIWNSDKPMAGQ